jgi:small subunit ribosomal protein S4
MGEKICAHAKCATLRKPYPPGIHGKGKRKGRREASEFGRQLREKQKMRFLYGLSEHQFARMVEQAMKKSAGDPGLALARLLETRLDNVVFRLGFASSPQMARSMITHGHVQVNGKKVKTPSFQVRVEQVVSVLPSFPLSAAEDGQKDISSPVPPWLSREDQRRGKVQTIPDTQENLHSYDKRVIIEYYAR